MSTIKFASNASGSGSVTIASPNTNSDVTLSLPSDNGTLLYANSSGNVGIGTSSPSYKLDVTGSLRSTGLANFDNAISLNTASLNYLYYTSALALAQSGTGERIRIDSSGNVGIGKTNPQASLDYRETVNVINTNTTAVASRTYVLTASLTLTLPATPTAGDWVTVQNSSGTTTAVIARNGSNIMSLAENLTLDADFVSVTLVYADATRGWVFG